MKKTFLFMIAAILTLGTSLTSCSKDNDDDANNKAQVGIYYYVKVSDDVLKVADVEINFMDITGAKKKEVLTSTKWKKELRGGNMPITQGVWAKLTPKNGIAEDEYQLNLLTLTAYETYKGTQTLKNNGIFVETKKNANNTEDVSTFCQASPSMGFELDAEGKDNKVEIDFGGNAFSLGSLNRFSNNLRWWWENNMSFSEWVDKN